MGRIHTAHCSLCNADPVYTPATAPKNPSLSPAGPVPCCSPQDSPSRRKPYRGRGLGSPCWGVAGGEDTLLILCPDPDDPTSGECAVAADPGTAGWIHLKAVDDPPSLHSGPGPGLARRMLRAISPQAQTHHQIATVRMSFSGQETARLQDALLSFLFR